MIGITIVLGVASPAIQLRVPLRWAGLFAVPKSWPAMAVPFAGPPVAVARRLAGPEIPGAPKSVPAKAFPSAVVHVTEAVCPAAGVVRDTAMFTDATPSVVVTLVAVNWIESAWAAVAAMEASSPANRKRIFIF